MGLQIWDHKFKTPYQNESHQNESLVRSILSKSSSTIKWLIQIFNEMVNPLLNCENLLTFQIERQLPQVLLERTLLNFLFKIFKKVTIKKCFLARLPAVGCMRVTLVKNRLVKICLLGLFNFQFYWKPIS